MPVWKPGQSGNPKGHRNGAGQLAELARTHTETAIETLAEICQDAKAPPNARVSAASALRRNRRKRMICLLGLLSEKNRRLEIKRVA